MITIQGAKYMSDFEAKKAIIDMGKRMYAKGYLVADDGCISIKTGPDAIWITPAGVEKGFLTTDMLVKVNLSGKVLMGMVGKPKELPEEAAMMLKVYQCCEDIRCVIHGYPPLANVFAIQGRSMAAADFSKSIKRLGAIPVLENQTPEGIAGICQNTHGALLKHNGSMTWGTGCQSCYHYMETMEYYATVLGHMGSGAGGQVQSQTEPIPKGTTGIYVPRDYEKPVQESRAVPVHGLKGVTELIRPRDKKPVREMKGSADLPADKAAIMAEVVRQVTQALRA